MTDFGAWLQAKTWARGVEPSPGRSRSAGAGRIRLIAFYLPQFHPIEENDRWWGKGFTEWTNVVKGTPQFVGHQQPHLPGELGFYDLRVPEVREQQAELAREHGVGGFCYYHYWFGGKRLLERPFREVVRSKHPDFPFCVCWANENWSRRWDGSESEILIAQQHSPEDDTRFIHELFDAFSDERYIRVDGRPLLLVYRPLLLPDPKATADRWRDECRKARIAEPFLCNVHSFDTAAPVDIGFDAAVEFPPNLMPMRRLNDGLEFLNAGFRGDVYEYPQLPVLTPPAYPLFRALFPDWDNTVRRKGTATIVHGGTPGKYGEWLSEICHYTNQHFNGDMKLVFVNAWNEWGEGCHLEPDTRMGRAYLERTRDVLRRFDAFAQESTRGS